MLEVYPWPEESPSFTPFSRPSPHTLSFRILPKTTFNSFKSLYCNFLWGSHEDARKIAWIKWDDLCLPKVDGGLGFLNLLSFNSALLCKWVWRFLSNEDSLWKKLIISRFGEPPWVSQGAAGARKRSNCSGWWRSITNLIEGERGAWFWDLIERKIGDGKDTYFWRGSWIGTTSLKDRYPRLFHLSLKQDARVCDMGFWDQGIWNWNLEWRRPLRCSEISLEKDLVQQLSPFSPSDGVPDGWVWKNKPSYCSSVKHLYHSLQRIRPSTTHTGHSSKVFRNIWKSLAPFKSQVLGWRIIRNRLPTLDNLRKRSAILGTDFSCAFCEDDEESCRHLFFDCAKVRFIWDAISTWIGISWVAPQNPIDHLQSFSYLLGGGKNVIRLSGLWICIVWVWWKWRNTIRFENEKVDLRRILEEIKCRFWNWCLVHGETITNLSYVTWSSINLYQHWLSS